MSTVVSDLPREPGSAETAPLRFVTAASLFDGHDAAINIMRRLIQSQGVEVIHLGHNRSVDDIVRAAIQEDADGIAISSYQGGHNEFFRYMVDRLRELGAGHIKVFGGGGGTITPDEIRDLMQSWADEYDSVEAFEKALDAARTPLGRVKKLTDAVQEDWAEHRGALMDIDVNGTQARVHRSPARFSASEVGPRSGSYLRGADNRRVLSDKLGMSESDLDALYRSGALQEEALKKD